MRFTTTAILSTFAGMAAAVTNHTVMVGTGGLHFVPNNITADVNDMITFVFTAKNHTITQSSFAKPCTPLAGGFDSGFVASKAGANITTNYTIMVTTAKPVWAFCAQALPATGNHCMQGMVFSINPDAGKVNATGKATSAADFMANALALNVNGAGNPVSTTASAGTTIATGGADPASSGSAAATGSVSMVFPTGDSSSGSAAATGTDSASSSAASGTDSASSSAASGGVANAGATAAADQTVSGSASGSASAAAPTKSGARALSRSSAAVFAAIGLVLACIL